MQPTVVISQAGDGIQAVGSERGRQHEDAHADGVADHQRGTHHKAESAGRRRAVRTLQLAGSPVIRQRFAERRREHSQRLVDVAAIDHERWNEAHGAHAAREQQQPVVKGACQHRIAQRARRRPAARDRVTSSMPIISPLPRTSPMQAKRALQLAQPRRGSIHPPPPHWPRTASRSARASRAPPRNTAGCRRRCCRARRVSTSP